MSCFALLCSLIKPVKLSFGRSYVGGKGRVPWKLIVESVELLILSLLQSLILLTFVVHSAPLGLSVLQPNYSPLVVETAPWKHMCYTLP